MKPEFAQLNRTLDWSWLPELSQWTLDQALAIQQIPAPTFHEAQRASYLQESFRALGLQEISTDALNNVYGVRRGLETGKPALMIAAHTDTIFPPDTDLSVKHGDGVIAAPGLGDNSIGVAGMLALGRALNALNLQLPCDVWLVATTGEEGLGDLRGMRAAFQRLGHEIGAVINLEGLAFGHIYNAGISVKRLKIGITVEGGHSWLHFGRPSATHALMQIGARITALQPPTTPRTTYNIGMVEGGDAINAIATHAALWLDLRSEHRAALEALEAQVRAQIAAVVNEDMRCAVEIVGDRPAGSIPTNHPLVLAAFAALEAVGTEATLEIGSTDANIPLAEGCPAVTIGITRGGNAHRLDEYIETAPIADGLRQLVLLTLAAAHNFALSEIK